jgi:hypothetical protein
MSSNWWNGNMVAVTSSVGGMSPTFATGSAINFNEAYVYPISTVTFNFATPVGSVSVPVPNPASTLWMEIVEELSLHNACYNNEELAKMVKLVSEAAKKEIRDYYRIKEERVLLDQYTPTSEEITSRED